MSDKKKVLIAEDEKEHSEALALKLGSAGYEAVVAENGRRALELLSESAFDFVLLDLVMPEVDGFGVLEGMKARNIQTPVIVLSNLGQADNEQRVRELGAKEFLIKSDVSIASVIERVNALLSE